MSDIEDMARLAVEITPFCGPSPESNRWGEIEYKDQDGKTLDVSGEAVALAVKRGWLYAERLKAPGYVLREEDGPWEMMWRYHKSDVAP